MSDIRDMKAAMGAEVDWLCAGEPHGRTPARMMPRRMAARAVMGASFDAGHIALARRTLRAAGGEWDRVDLRCMIDLGAFLLANEVSA